MMRTWHFWLNTLILWSQYNPPRLVELLMLFLALALLGIWQLTPNSAYLVLALSYIVGASVSILVREAISPSPYPQASQLTAVLLLIISIDGFAYLFRLLY